MPHFLLAINLASWLSWQQTCFKKKFDKKDGSTVCWIPYFNVWKHKAHSWKDSGTSCSAVEEEVGAPVFCHWEDHEALGKICCWSHPNFQIGCHPWTCVASWWRRVWTGPKTWQREFFHLWRHGGHASGEWCMHGPGWLHSWSSWLSWLVSWACQHHFCEATYLCHPYKLDFEGWQLKGQLWSMEKWWTSPWNPWRQWWSWNLPQWSRCWWRLCLQTHLWNWTCKNAELACLAEHCKQAMCYM